MKELFFEDPLWLYVLLFIAEVVMVWLWSKSRERAALLRCLIPLGLAGVVFAVATLVVTDREKIQRATDELVADAKAGRLTAFERWLDREFQGTFRSKPMNRDQALAEARRVLGRGSIKDIEIQKNEIKVQGADAYQRLQTAIRFSGGGFSGRLPMMWRIHWIRTTEGWRIYEVSEPQIGMSM